jgi:hypothetical protein
VYEVPQAGDGDEDVDGDEEEEPGDEDWSVAVTGELAKEGGQRKGRESYLMPLNSRRLWCCKKKAQQRVMQPEEGRVSS